MADNLDNAASGRSRAAGLERDEGESSHAVVSVLITNDTDIATARHQARTIAARLGFSSTDVTVVTAAVSELARNIVLYAKRGEIMLAPVTESGRFGIVIIARDGGLGIPDIRLAMLDGYSTSGGMGVGLPGVKRLMDEFEIDSRVGIGTVVMVKKWKRVRGSHGIA